MPSNPDVAVAGPILGEFGWLIFDLSPHVRRWLRHCHHEHKVVICNPAHRCLFERATEFIDIPKELMPGGRAVTAARSWSRRCGIKPRKALEPLLKWRGQQWPGATSLAIPYRNRDVRLEWGLGPEHICLESDSVAVGHPYFVVHARKDRRFPKKNWPERRWNRLAHRVKGATGLDVVSIGTKGGSHAPLGSIDYRDAPLEDTIALLNKAEFSVSSNSGPTHLSLMCGCPTFCWGQEKAGKDGWTLKDRMESYTNPLDAPCTFEGIGWQPPLERVERCLGRFLRDKVGAVGLAAV